MPRAAWHPRNSSANPAFALLPSPYGLPAGRLCRFAPLRTDFLPLEVEIWRHGALRGPTSPGARGGNPAVQAVGSLTSNSFGRVCRGTTWPTSSPMNTRLSMRWLRDQSASFWKSLFLFARSAKHTRNKRFSFLANGLKAMLG